MGTSGLFTTIGRHRLVFALATIALVASVVRIDLVARTDYEATATLVLTGPTADASEVVFPGGLRAFTRLVRAAADSSGSRVLLRDEGHAARYAVEVVGDGKDPLLVLTASHPDETTALDAIGAPEGSILAGLNQRARAAHPELSL